MLVAQSCLTLCDLTDCTCWAPLFMNFSRQEYWSGLSFLSPGDLPNPRIEIHLLQVDSLPPEPHRFWCICNAKLSYESLGKIMEILLWRIIKRTEWNHIKYFLAIHFLMLSRISNIIKYIYQAYFQKWQMHIYFFQIST